MAASLKDALHDMVERVLPHLDTGSVALVVELLLKEGVKKVMDVRNITIPILKQTLDTVDATDLNRHFQNNYGDGSSAGSCTNAQSTARITQNAAPAASRSSLGVLQENRMAVRSVLNSMPTYDKDSHVMTVEVTAAINEKRRPLSRVQMVANIVEDCKKHVPNLERSMFKSVADDLCAKYPDSFKDTIPVSRLGSESLAKQLADKFDNNKRPNKGRGKNNDPPATAYGCISWDPPMPDEESLASQEGTRLALVEMFKRAKKDWVWREIRKKMEDTFYLQRKDINSHNTLIRPHAAAEPKRKKRKQATEAEDNQEVVDNPEAEETTIVSQLRERWPFLFTLRGMNQHFTKLTGLDMKDLWESYVRERGSNLIEFLATKSDALAKERRIMVRAENAGRGWAKHAALLCMLSKHFKEDWETLVIFTESTTSFSEVADAVTFPHGDFPVIVAAGEKVHHTDKFYICVDQQPIAQVKTIAEAIIMLFELYFVYHKFEYYSDTNVTFFYFLQRVVASLIPVTGRKASSAAKHKTVSEKVNRFNNKFVEYLQVLEAEANAEN